MMLGDTNVTDYKSISMDWAGGGVVSTTEDLLKLGQGIFQYKIINKTSFSNVLNSLDYKFMDGITYRNGIMEVEFGKMSMLMPNTPKLIGHSGLLGTLLFYSMDYDAYIIGNIGSTDDVGDSFEMMFWTMQYLKEIKELKSK